jgi:D-sedoheptulose 7-phosphate isomerase
MQKQVNDILSEVNRYTAELVNDSSLKKAIVDVAEAIVTSVSKGGKVIVFGNGGSAADSQHFVAELVGRFKKERPAISAIALTTNTSALTAISNDYGFEHSFSRQLCALAKEGDVAIAISTSGSSPNIVKAVLEAQKLKLVTVGLTGGEGGRLKQMCHHMLCVPAASTPRIQECHIIILHIIAELVEQRLHTK